MRYAHIHTAMLLATVVSVGACNRQEPVRETTSESAVASVQERNKDAAELEKRVVDVELKWSEMQSRVQEKNLVLPLRRYAMRSKKMSRRCERRLRT